MLRLLQEVWADLVSGTSEITIDYEAKQFQAGNLTIKEGDIITIDGGSGKVIKGLVPTVQPEISDTFLQ